MSRGITIRDCEQMLGQSYDMIVGNIKNRHLTMSKLNRDGNAFITVEKIDLLEVKGNATLFFYEGMLDNIVLSPEWNMYTLINGNGERMCVDEATSFIFKQCHDVLMKEYGPKINDDYIPEIYNISQRMVAELYMTPARDNVSMVLRRIK